MKLTLFRLTTLVVSTLIGLAAFSLKELVELPLMDIPPVETASDIACFSTSLSQYRNFGARKR